MIYNLSVLKSCVVTSITYFNRFIQCSTDKCDTRSYDFDVEQQSEKKEGDDDPYQNLMTDLITRYKNDLEGQKEVDMAEQFERVTREVKDLKKLLQKN